MPSARPRVCGRVAGKLAGAWRDLWLGCGGRVGRARSTVGACGGFVARYGRLRGWRQAMPSVRGAGAFGLLELFGELCHSSGAIRRAALELSRSPGGHRAGLVEGLPGAWTPLWRRFVGWARG